MTVERAPAATYETGRPAPWRRLGPVATSCLLLVVVWAFTALVSSAMPARLVTPEGTLVPMSWHQQLEGIAYEYGVWIMLVPLVVGLARVLSRLRLKWRLALHVVVMVLAGLAYSAGRELLHYHRLARWPDHLLGSTLRGVLFYAGSIGVYTAVDGYFRFRAQQQETMRVALLASRLQAQLADARLDALRMQLQPHFLFNTLNAISALVDWRPADARRMITILSELLRLTLERSDAAEVALSDELAWLERYLALQQIRFGDALAVEMRVDPAVLGARVPTLIFQPLVENALTHGVDAETGATAICISAAPAGERLRLSVSDAGPGIRVHSTARTGIGLANTRGRLGALYGEAQLVTLRDLPGGGAEVAIELPLTLAAAPVGA